MTFWPGSCYDKDIVGQQPKGKGIECGESPAARKSDSDNELSTVELLSRVPLDELETAILALREDRTAQEIRAALIERIARAPLSEFQALKIVYLAYCADVEE